MASVREILAARLNCREVSSSPRASVLNSLRCSVNLASEEQIHPMRRTKLNGIVFWCVEDGMMN